MKSFYKTTFKNSKKRKPLYPDEYKMNEINEQKKLKRTMDNYFKDYNKMSKKLGIKDTPYLLVSEKDYEDAIYNTDLMIRKWNDFYDFTPTYNPQIEDNYYNDSSIIFENTKNHLIKKDYKKRIEKFYGPPEQEITISYNQTFKSGKLSNMNFYNSIGVKNEENKEIKKNENDKNIDEKKNIDNIEEEYKFDENDKNINEEKNDDNIEEEYKFDENDKNIDEKKNEDKIEEEYNFEESNKIEKLEENINNGNKLKDVNENIEEEYFFEENEEIDKKDGPKLNTNKMNKNEENNNFEIEENIEGKKESNKKIKDNTEKLPLLNDIIKDDTEKLPLLNKKIKDNTEKLPLLNDIIKDDSKNISKNNTLKNKTKVENKLKDNEDMLNYMEKEEIDDKIIEEDLPKVKEKENKFKKSISLNKERDNEKVKLKKSNTITLNKVEIKTRNSVKKDNDNSISEIKKSYTTKLKNKLNNRLSISRENKLKKKNKKEKTYNPNDTIYDKMKKIDNNTKIITTAFNRNLIQNLNKRQKIISGWDSQNKFLIFIYIEKLNNNKRDVESLLIRYYSLRQKRTHYKIVSIRLLCHMGVFPSNIIDRIKINGYSTEIMKAVEKIIVKENKK